MRTINELVEEVKSREKQELIDAVYSHGEKCDGGFELKFDEESKPIVAGYICDDPCDIVVSCIKLSHDGYLSIEGVDKNNPYDEYVIEPSDIFAGHLDFITQSIG